MPCPSDSPSRDMYCMISDIIIVSYIDYILYYVAVSFVSQSHEVESRGRTYWSSSFIVTTEDSIVDYSGKHYVVVFVFMLQREKDRF